MRCLYIFNNDFNLVWSKSFPTVEARYHKPRGEVLPDGEDVGALFCEALEEHARTAQIVPVVEASPLLSPLVFAEWSGLGFVVGLPLVKAAAHSLLEAPEVGIALETVSLLARFLSSQGPPTPGHAFWSNFSLAVAMAMPLGTLVRPLVGGQQLSQQSQDDEALSLSTSASSASTPAADGSLLNKTPAWRIETSAPVKKPRILVCVEEVVESHQYDNAFGARDSHTVSGLITLVTDVSGSAPQVTLKVFCSTTEASPEWRGSIESESVLSDAYVSSFASTLQGQDRVYHIALVPSRFEHVVMRYDSIPPVKMPFRAFYQLKPVAPTEAKILVQVKLHEGLSNSFEGGGCQVVLPFSGAIQSFEMSPTEGTVQKRDERTLSRASYWFTPRPAAGPSFFRLAATTSSSRSQQAL